MVKRGAKRRIRWAGSERDRPWPIRGVRVVPFRLVWFGPARRVRETREREREREREKERERGRERERMRGRG